MFWVRDLKLKLDQSDVSKVTHVCHFPSFSSYKLKVTVKNPKKKKKLSGFNDNYNLHMIYIIITPLHTSTFSLTIIIKHLFLNEY